MRPITALVLTVAATAVLPAAASASTVSVDGTTAIFRSGNRASVVNTDSRPVPVGSTFTDTAQFLSAGPGCDQASPVWCQTAENVEIRLGRGDDVVTGWNFFNLLVTGAGGDDEINASGNLTDVDGGDGRDRIVVSSNAGAIASGGAGNDVIQTEFGPEATLSGDGGNDVVIGAATFINTISGGDGNDLLVGDALGNGSIDGGNGVDIIRVTGDFGGGYAIAAGRGTDIVIGGPGSDTVDAGPGDDLIAVAADGVADTVDCGSGFDRVYADADDLLTNCERRYLRPAPSSVADAGLASYRRVAG
jgi:Ca2+-binding RTX toxin-like protein